MRWPAPMYRAVFKEMFQWNWDRKGQECATLGSPVGAHPNVRRGFAFISRLAVDLCFATRLADDVLVGFESGTISKPSADC